MLLNQLPYFVTLMLYSTNKAWCCVEQLIVSGLMRDLRSPLEFPVVTRACERSVSGAENGAERIKNSWSGSGAVIGF